MLIKNHRSSALLLIFCVAAGCAGHRPAPGIEQLRQQYRNAILDARVANPDEISTDLIAIVPSDTTLLWRGQEGSKQVLVVTWTSWDGYDSHVGQSLSLSQEVWVTVVPEIQSFFANQKKPTGNLTLRIEQLLGLPPHNGKTRFVEMWVDRNDLFRPSVDPEISDHEAELDLPVPEDLVSISLEHMKWFTLMREKSYGEDGFPWTRLGYTYDWGRSDSERGLSEFVIRSGATVEVRSVTSTEDYIVPAR